jgi:hypothetical protein
VNGALTSKTLTLGTGDAFTYEYDLEGRLSQYAHAAPADLPEKPEVAQGAGQIDPLARLEPGSQLLDQQQSEGGIARSGDGRVRLVSHGWFISRSPSSRRRKRSSARKCRV